MKRKTLYLLAAVSAPADAEADAEGSADLPPMVVATGSFVDQGHPASGQIESVELPDGSITVTFVDDSVAAERNLPPMTQTVTKASVTGTDRT